MKEKFIKIWKDPVGSKLISVGIIAIVTSLFIYVKSLILNEEFKRSFIEFWSYKLAFWIIVGVILVFYVLNLFRNNKRSIANSQEPIFTYDEKTIKLDQVLFNKIRNEILPQDTAIGFLRHNNFAGFSFNPKLLDDLDSLESENIKSDFEFFNPELELLKKDLISKISHFTELIGTETFPARNERQTVPPEWEIEQPKRFREVVNDIHTSQFKICEKYDEFIRRGRSLLKV